jgi:hypothetical protein
LDNDYEPYHYGSVARWCKMNSYGGHHMQPFPMSAGFDGILNTIDANGKIEWIHLDMTKAAAIGSLSYYVKPRISPYWQQCDVVILVAAGQGGPHETDLLTAGPPFFSIISEKTSSDNYEDAILNFNMAGVIHEYIHAAFNHGDYGYDRWTYTGAGTLWNKRARWTGISGMYPHSLPNRPYHLDPWAKLKFGWIDYEILTEGEYVNKSLPIIAQPEDDGIWPKVIVIPIDVPWSFNEPDWDQGHYLIIENRRRVPDSYDDKIADESSDGGFLVWEFDQRLNDDERYGLTLVEADGNYDMKFKDSRWIWNQWLTKDGIPSPGFSANSVGFLEPARRTFHLVTPSIGHAGPDNHGHFDLRSRCGPDCTAADHHSLRRI